MKRKKSSTRLPRVTVLAMSRRELVSFVQAVENLRYLVDALKVVADGMGQELLAAGLKRGKKPKETPPPAEPAVGP